jgi:hypothetical protein
MAQLRKKTDTGHWKIMTLSGIPLDFKPEDHWGFIYCITFLLTGEMYIGKKNFWRTNKSGSKRFGPSDWRTYCSSSEHVNARLEEYGPDCFRFEIISLHCTKGCHSYSESNVLHKVDALTARDITWDERIFINRQIGPVRWIPKNCDCSTGLNNAVNFVKEDVKALQ